MHQRMLYRLANTVICLGLCMPFSSVANSEQSAENSEKNGGYKNAVIFNASAISLSSETLVIVSYKIQLNGFSNQDYAVLQRYLRSFSGFNGLQLLTSSPSTIEMQYSSSAEPGLIEYSLNRALQSMAIEAYMVFQENTFLIKLLNRTNKSRLKFGEW